jgi:addiction module RelE/StbE family toxin
MGTMIRTAKIDPAILHLDCVMTLVRPGLVVYWPDLIGDLPPTLVAEETLDAIYRDHKLIGTWRGRRECHIESDWLLIYMVELDRVVFERTGTYSDLFEK